jgi:hypothetical protein
VPVERHGELALQPQVMITATIDHRFIERGPDLARGSLRRLPARGRQRDTLEIPA